MNKRSSQDGPILRDVSAGPRPKPLSQPTPFVQANEPGKLADLTPEEADARADDMIADSLRLLSA